MAADSKSTRRSARGRNEASETASRRRGGEQEDNARRRAAGSGARKSTTTGRKAATKGRKSASGRAGESGRKRTAKKSASARGAQGGTNRRASSASRGGRAAASSARSGRKQADALALLKEDHERVDGMLKKFERMKEGDERKREMLQRILEEVRVHAQVEEELFYPALRTVLEEDGSTKELKLIAEADTEHETVKWLMSELEDGRLDGMMMDARVKVMGEYIRHHVEEEEGPIFRAAKRSAIDLAELGQQIAARKRELAGEGAEGEGAMGERGVGGEVAQPMAPPLGR